MFSPKVSSVFEYHQGKGSPRIPAASIRACLALAQSPTDRCQDVFERQEGNTRKVSFSEQRQGGNVFVDAKVEPGLWSTRFFVVTRDPRGNTWIADATVSRLTGCVSGKTIDNQGFHELTRASEGHNFYAPALLHVSTFGDRNAMPSQDEQDRKDGIRMAETARALVDEGRNGSWGRFPQGDYVYSKAYCDG
ncbi:hypothetical protein IV102_07910 [bacterium]|nr:hypothetical protein [bacterium]